MSDKGYHLYGGLKGGSAIVEAMLTRAGLPFEVTDFEWDDIYGSAAAVLAVNPVGQIPALKTARRADDDGKRGDGAVPVGRPPRRRASRRGPAIRCAWTSCAG